MRVLHIVSERGFSGGEDQLLHVVRALADAGHENRFVLQPEAAFQLHAEAHGQVVETVRMRGSLDIRAVRALRRRFRLGGVDLLHLADSRAHKLGWFALRKAADLPPAVVTRRMDYPLKRPWLARKQYGSRVAAVVAISQAVVDEIAKVGVERGRIHLIHDGVDETFADGLSAKRAEARAAFGYGEEHVVVVSLAALRPRKGQRDLLQAFASLRAAHPDARLLLGGEGDERSALEARAAELEGSVQLPGRIDARQALAAADVACVPSLREGLSVFSLEAQLAERPVVASRVGGLVESVADGVSGVLFEPGDADGLARALGPLLGDAPRRAALGAAGRARVLEHFTARAMAQKTVALYEALAAP